ncbi:MAG TPA: menaquinone biosynthesis protein [Bacteroidia bacterium]|nr:menaquinone biosynthesis protein [Bacteroidia bacterium]
MVPKIKLSVVSYLNSKPFIYGLENSDFVDEFSLELDIPAVCAEKLIRGTVDIGLVPVAILPELNEYHLLTDYCIGANGNVESVVLVSQVPLEEIKKVMLDYQSRTSVQLARVLAENFWHIEPEWIQATEGYEDHLEGDIAGVIIGDRALLRRDQFKYVYDLSGEWKKFTGLPFVFACWVSNKIIPEQFIFRLNASAKKGIQNIQEVLDHFGSGEIPTIEASNYLQHVIDFHFNDEKRKALELFLSYVKQLKKNISTVSLHQ